MKLYQLYQQDKEAQFTADHHPQHGVLHFHRTPRGFVEVRDNSNKPVYLVGFAEVTVKEQECAVQAVTAS